jgi:hypothetical protein
MEKRLVETIANWDITEWMEVSQGVFAKPGGTRIGRINPTERANLILCREHPDRSFTSARGP